MNENSSKKSPQPRTSRLIKGVFAKGFGQGTQIFIRLAEIPIFLMAWGAAHYGEWLILAAIPQYLTLSDFGLAGATNREMAILVNKDEKERAASTFQTSSFVILLLTLFIASLFVLSISFLPIKQIFDFSFIGEEKTLLIGILLSLQIIVSGQVRLLFGGFACAGRYPLGFILISLIPLLSFAASCIVLLLGGGCLSIAVSMLVMQVVGFVGMRLLLLKYEGWIKYGLNLFNASHFKRLLKPALANMAFPVGEALSYQTPRLIIGALMGPAVVALFVTHRQLARLINLASTMSFVFQSELSMAFGSGSLARYSSLAAKYVAILIWLAIFVASVTFIGGRFVYELWIGKVIPFDFLLFTALLVASFSEAVWRSALSPVLAINQHSKASAGYLIVSFVLIPSMFLAVKYAGLEYLSMVLIVAEIAMLFIAFKSLTKAADVSLAKLLRSFFTVPSELDKLFKKTTT